MSRWSLLVFVVLAFQAHAADPFSSGTMFNESAYGGGAYEPRYCNPDRYMPMRECHYVNSVLARDYFLRSLEVKVGGDDYARERKRIETSLLAECNKEVAQLKKDGATSPATDIHEFICLRKRYDSTARMLVK